MQDDDFQFHLDRHPDDWAYRLVYADWLEAQGDPFCEKQRWMVLNKRRPYDNGFWNWWSVDGHEFSLGKQFDLLRRGRLSKWRPRQYREYLTRQTAEQDLHEALLASGEISGGAGRDETT